MANPFSTPVSSRIQNKLLIHLFSSSISWIYSKTFSPAKLSQPQIINILEIFKNFFAGTIVSAANHQHLGNIRKISGQQAVFRQQPAIIQQSTAATSSSNQKQQPATATTSSNQQQQPTTVASSSNQQQQPAAATSSSNHQQKPAVATSSSNQQQQPAAETSSGNQPTTSSDQQATSSGNQHAILQQQPAII